MNSPDPASAGGSSDRTAGQSAGRVARTTAAASRRGTWSDLDQPFVMVGELLGGVLLWGGVGWLVGTRVGGHPWVFAVGVLVGFAGGFYLLWLRAEGRIGSTRAGTAGTRGGGRPHRPGSPAVGDEEESA
jgi:F0F1-type ATP synthase assembly protein I